MHSFSTGLEAEQNVKSLFMASMSDLAAAVSCPWPWVGSTESNFAVRRSLLDEVDVLWR